MLKVGELLKNRYTVKEIMNCGGMAQIYKVSDKDLGDRECVLKELLINNFQQKDRSTITAAFQREATLLARLNHGNLPRATDFFVDQSGANFYLVVDFIDGQDLEQVRQSRRCHEDEVIKWSISILEVLDYLHHQMPPIIYRDLKPANIMLEKTGQIKLIDFGIAREYDPAFNAKQTVIGSHGYAPPEQYHGKAEPRSDIYSLGVVMHFLICGIDPQPFALQPIEFLAKDIDPRLATIINKAADPRINYRYADVVAMKQDLQNLLNNGSAVGGAATTSHWQAYEESIVKNLEVLKNKFRDDAYKINNLNRSLNFFKAGFTAEAIKCLAEVGFDSWGAEKPYHLTKYYILSMMNIIIGNWLESEKMLNTIIHYHPDFSQAYEMLSLYQVYIDLEKEEQEENNRKEMEAKAEAKRKEEMEEAKRIEMIKLARKEAWEKTKTKFLSWLPKW